MADKNKISGLMWFRRDLRLHDNTALTLLIEQALEYADSHHSASLHAVFICTPKQWLEHHMSLVQVDLMMRTVNKLKDNLANKLGITLHLLQTDSYANSAEVLTEFCVDNKITHVACNYEYELNEQQRDARVNKKLSALNIDFKQYHDQCILPPDTIKTGDDTMYKVFTPFYKKWLQTLEISPLVLYEIDSFDINQQHSNNDTNIKANNLSSSIDDIHHAVLDAIKAYYQISDSEANVLLKTARADYPAGEQAAIERLHYFIKEDIEEYTLTRDQPALIGTSHLSAYLTIGAISPRLCYQQAEAKLQENSLKSNGSTDIERWISELAWRDFYRHVIVDRPNIVQGVAYKKDTDSKVNWSYDSNDFEKWCTGMTGVPLIDAAMRCLNQTGFMHNRLRMVTAMFLTKDLFIDWRLGERYFIQNLIDGDFASNNGGWQWSASTGTDSAPYFRIMNPFSQAKTHDKEAIFIKTWLPELKDIPARILHDESKLRKALNEKGEFAHVNYPVPMVEHKQARLYAIAQFKGE